MQLTNALTVVLALACGAEAFKIRAFTGSGCTGNAQEINIWDNTCRDTNIISPMRSFRVLNYGAGRQVGTFWRYNFCSNSPPPMIIKDWRVDGSSNAGFKLNACLNIPETPRAIGSHSG